MMRLIILDEMTRLEGNLKSRIRYVHIPVSQPEFKL